MKIIEKVKEGKKYFNIYQCECGNIQKRRSDYKKSIVCSCKKINPTKSKFYNTWCSIKKKCSKNSKVYKNASICEEWKDFFIFEKWAIENFKENLLLTCLDKDFYYSPETCKYVSKLELQDIQNINEKRQQTIFNKYGVTSYSQSEEFKNLPKREYSEESKEKYKNTCLEKYGVTNTSKLESIKEKITNTNLEKYGVNCVFKNENIKNKIKETNIKNLGVEYPTQSKEVRNKVVATNIRLFGKEYYMQTKEYLESVKTTCLGKYGVDHHTKRVEYKNNVRKTLKENKTYKLYNGKLASELADEKNISAYAMRQRLLKYGPEIAMSMEKKESGLEIFFEDNILKPLNIPYEKQFKISNRVADFKIGNFIIECDGLYWHSELQRAKNYHKEKRDLYISNGFTPMFFTEDEILNQKEKVESIILNKIGKSNRIFARKCEIKELSKEEANQFFEQNHLMGKGRGKSFGLYYDNNLVTAIRVFKLDTGLDVSRFCHKLQTNVVGAFSKLIKHVEKTLNPTFIQTFIDLRYGSGEYLNGLGFEKKTEYLSFSWIKNSIKLHRMNFPSNSGYNSGFVKLWDCGQAKYIKEYLSTGANK